MRSAWVLRAITVAVLAALVGWIVHNTSWVEIEERIPDRGAAATNARYALEKIAAAAGTTVVHRTALEPMPPAGATLFLDSTSWNLFPERDLHLKAWVEAGGHLVLFPRAVEEDELRWIPLRLIAPAKARQAAPPASVGAAPEDDEGDDDATQGAPPPPSPQTRSSRTAPPLLPPAADPGLPVCETLTELPGSTPAFEPGRAYRRCLTSAQRRTCVRPDTLRAIGVQPAWGLANADRSFALRVPVGRGQVTGVAECLPINNHAVPIGDHALIDAAVLDLRPGAPLWIVDDEAAEPLRAWLWHNARAPVLLGLTAVALAVWRLMVRFGPREAPAARNRRSMGEQVRGTGEFIAGTEPQALHAATRRAFDDIARTRIAEYAQRTDPERIDALAALLAPAVPVDRAALLSALHPGARSTKAQWLSAIATVEQVRRALARAPAPPLP